MEHKDASPGPWLVFSPGGKGSEQHLEILSADGERVAIVCQPGMGPSARSIANAGLLSEAWSMAKRLSEQGQRA